ncbi:hypothetical protein ACIU1J_05465 [Azospirillum doebereinerae]|uniref:hypothetical protein n=1 Tax=Azospirillum doebereinerae TaxID=92933 RepID=UPI001EE621D0|nr:hypothetical protein [Azospirillum doebereinerae]MCG5240864.1 hypothetical protein [Azospirillum doebereinerae]
MGGLPDSTMSALRQPHGTETDAKIAAARGMIERAAQRWPGVWDFLDRSGLGNSPHLIEQLAARAARRSRT